MNKKLESEFNNETGILFKDVCDEGVYAYWYIGWLEKKIISIQKESNNVLYFNDSSDYKTSLWKILKETGVEFDEDGYPVEELKYVE